MVQHGYNIFRKTVSYFTFCPGLLVKLATEDDLLCKEAVKRYVFSKAGDNSHYFYRKNLPAALEMLLVKNGY